MIGHFGAADRVLRGLCLLSLRLLDEGYNFDFRSFVLDLRM